MSTVSRTRFLITMGCVLVTLATIRVQCEDCTPKDRPDLKCDVIDSGAACTNQGPAYEGHTGQWPAAPRQFHASPYVRRYPNENKHYSGFVFSWLAPDNTSFNKPTGFQLVLKPVGYGWGSTWCRLFNMTQSTWNNSDIQSNNTPAQFEYDLDMDDDKSSYRVNFNSLPRGPPNWLGNFIDNWWLRIPAENYKEDTANNIFWRTTAVVEWVPSKNLLNVNFILAPVSYGFKEYTVALQNRSFANLVEQIVQVNTSHDAHSLVITDVCPGMYYVSVRPYNPDPKNERGQCVCKYRGKCSDSPCYGTTIGWMYLDGPVCPTIPTTEAVSTTDANRDQSTYIDAITDETSFPPNDMTSAVFPEALPSADNLLNDLQFDKYLIGVIAGAVGGTLIILGFVCMRLYRNRASAELGTGRSIFQKISWIDRLRNVERVPAVHHSNTNVAFNSECWDLTTNRVRVFILYNPDNVYHENVVLHFANFLHRMCDCDVRIDKWFKTEIRSKTKLDWLHEEITMADKIVIMNSEGSYRRWKAMRDGKVYDKMEKLNPSSDTFLQGLRLITDNLENPVVDFNRYISVRFNYTKPEFEIPTITVGNSKYVMMDHLEDLFFHLHSMNKYEPGLRQNVLGINEHGFSSYSEEGRHLHDSIIEMHNFLNDHPQWFEELYGAATKTLAVTPPPKRPSLDIELKHSDRNQPNLDGDSVFTADDCMTILHEEISVEHDVMMVRREDIRMDAGGVGNGHGNRLVSVGSIEV